VIIDLIVIWDYSHQKNAQGYICQRQKDAGEHQKHPFEDATLKLVLEKTAKRHKNVLSNKHFITMFGQFE